MRRVLALSLITVVAVVSAACGADDEDGAAPPEDAIKIEMVDNAYEPDAVDVAAGEELTFVFENAGAALHEAYVGDVAAQEEHAEAMASGEEMEHGGGHDGGAEAIDVEPGSDGELTYTFEEPGEYLIGCHQPGHYEDGMKIEVTVT
jgi:uncharacterized cupredoxin-like copper-binding protein